MPTLWKKPCKQPGCTALVQGGYCAAHARPIDDGHHGLSAAQRGYGAEWRMFRERYAATHPAICVWCNRAYESKRMHLDHIIPHKGDRTLLFNEDNVQWLCASCHSTKTARTDGAWGNSTKGGG